jgi:ankyrin repeat protein
MGFSTKAALARHIRLCHDNLTYEPTFPKISRCPIDQALNDAIRKEDLLAVRTLANEISDLPDFSTGFLMNSIIAGSRKAALIIMEILGDTKEMDHHGASGDTALHLLVEAEDEELLSVLLYTAVNINAMNQRCYTPLHVATSRGSVPIVKLLSEHPKTHLASYKATTSRVSILHLAVKSGKEEVLRFLLETSKEIFTDCNDIGDALITATKESRRDLASTLLLWGRKLNIENKYPKPYNSWILPEVDEMLPIFMGNITFEQALEKKWNATREAVVQGDVDKVEQLLTTISDINYFSNDSKTTLLATAALGSNIDMVQLLLSRGAQIVTNGTRGNNALENAAGGGHEQVMRLLLENGANVNEEPGLYSTGTALQCAAANGHLPIVQLLLELSADIEAYRGSSQNWEPTLIRAANSTSEPTAILLLKHGANRQARSLSGETALHIAAKLGKNNLLTHLLESGTNPNEHTSAGETALHIAATYGHHDLIPHLSQYGASIDATSHKTDGELETALHLAAKNGHEEFVSRLIKTGASVHSRTSVGNTALIYAASNGHSNVVELLLRGGANVDAADERGRTALGRANANNRSNTIEVLSSFGASLLYDPLRDTAVMAGNSLPLSEDDLLFTAWLRGWTN